jgi:threonine aldolase
MRKQLGGGTRQAGVLAAAALVALEEMVDRLTEDHRHARQLADGLAALDGIELDPTRIQTNIVYFKVTQPGWDAARLSQALATTEIRINPTGPNQLRAVTHYQIDAEQVDWTVATVKKLLASK